MQKRVKGVTLLDEEQLNARFPAWRGFKGYFNPRAGWAESGKVVAKLAEKATKLGVSIRLPLNSQK
jgi:glycine/D-amino acid oxidase-like deaminating enzyme